MNFFPPAKQMKKVLWMACLLGLFSFAYAQTSSESGIRGKVIDEQTDAPLAFATVRLYKAEDSALVVGAIADDQGAFALKAPASGAYYVQVDFLAYKALVTQAFTLEKGNLAQDLGTIGLAPEGLTLNEVVLQAERSQMELKLDKKVFNVGQDLANNGGSAVDILSNIPTVSVDPEGNVSLRGSGNVRILVDGKPSGLITFKGAEGLRQLQGNLIERVEIVSNPSARYEAEGMGGIINIVLKKDRRNGFNGSFDLNLGEPANYGGSVNVNYRTKKINFFTNYGIAYRSSPGENSLYQIIQRDNSTFITDQNTDRTRKDLSNNIRLGFDYMPGESHTLTSAFSYNYSDNKRYADLLYRDYEVSENNPTGTTLRTQDEKEIEPNLEYSLDYKKTFKKEGHEFVAALRYQKNWENSDQLFEETTRLNSSGGGLTTELFQRSENDESEKQLLLQADYVQPFSKDAKLEAGYRSTIRDLDNDYLVEELQAGNWVSLEGLSNNFLYEENIHASYLIWGQKVNSYSYQLGVRAEYSDIATRLLQTNQVNERDYLNFFPSAHVTYELKGGNNLQLSYSRRVRRPRYRELNPFFTFSDNRNFREGNPDLNPEFTDATELGYFKQFEKATLLSSIYYRYTSGIVEDIRRLDESGITITRPENLSTENAYGMEFAITYNPIKWMKLDGNFNFFRAITDGTNLGQTFESDTYSWFARLTSLINFWKDADLQLRGNYEAPRLTTQGKRKAIYFMDIAVSKDLFQKKATLALSISDVFNSRRFRTISEGENFYSESNFQWRPRQSTLTFSYRINQAKRQQRRPGGGDSEGGDF